MRKSQRSNYKLIVLWSGLLTESLLPLIPSRSPLCLCLFVWKRNKNCECSTPPRKQNINKYVSIGEILVTECAERVVDSMVLQDKDKFFAGLQNYKDTAIILGCILTAKPRSGGI